MSELACPLATVGELADWIGEPLTKPQDQARAALCLRAASAAVRAYTRRNWLDEQTGELAVIPDAVAMVTMAAASRTYLNPEAETTTRLDDAQQSRLVGEAGVYLTASEKQTLEQYKQSRRFGGISTISTTRGY
jgi:hypothetical protein